jgi:hypothetical protein
LNPARAISSFLLVRDRLAITSKLGRAERGGPMPRDLDCAPAWRPDELRDVDDENIMVLVVDHEELITLSRVDSGEHAG